MPERGSRGERSQKVATFNKVLQRLAELDRTQAQLARYLGVLPKRISAWKRGTGEPTASEFVRIAEWVGVPLDYFTGEESDLPRRPLTRDEWSIIDYIRDVDMDRSEVFRRLAQPVLKGAAESKGARTTKPQSKGHQTKR